MKNSVSYIANALLICAVVYLYFQQQQLSDSLIKSRKQLVSQTLLIVDESGNPRLVMDATNHEVTLTALDKSNTPRFQLAMDNAQNFNFFLFDVEGAPRVGYFSQSDGSFLKYDDQLAEYSSE